jgi:DNA-binding transcriptional regulator YiaG
MAAPKRTSHDYEQMLLASAREAVEIAKGNREPARSETRELTARSASVTPPPGYDGPGVIRVRKKMKVSQAVFASMLNVSPSAVRAWERGARAPDGPSRRLLEMADESPQLLLGRMRPKSKATR